MKPSWTRAPISWGIAALLFASVAAAAQDRTLSDRAKGLDTDANGVIDRDEARGPLADNFDQMDCDKSETLDGAEIRWFFRDGGCPETAAATPAQAEGRTAPASPPPLSDRARMADADGDGVLDRNEAGGPLAANFDKIDKDGSGTLDGGEIRTFFQGGGARPGGGGGRPPATVRLDAVITERMKRTVPVIGRLVARQNGIISSEVRGVVEEMRVEVGDRVARGAVLAVVARQRLATARDRQAAVVERMTAMVSAANAEYEKKRRELNRLDRLRRSAAFSRARYEDLEQDVRSRKGTLDERRAQLDEARAMLRQAEIDLADTQVKAPFPGVVIEKHTEIGAYLGLGARVVSLLNDTELEAEAEIPSDRLSTLGPGTEVEMRLDDGTGHRAVVRAVIPRENARTRTRTVRFAPRFDGTEQALADDQSVTLLVPVAAGRMVATVHKDAVVRSGSDTVVYVVEGGLARRVEVRLGDGIGPRFVVQDGVAPGQNLVVHGNETLGMGGPVRVTGAPKGAGG